MRLIVFVSACFVSSVHGQITFKAYTENTPAGGATSVATTSTLNIATNDGIFACVGHGEDTSTTVTGVSDGGSNTLAQAKHANGTGDSVGSVDLWYKTGAVANATATITATFSGSSTFRWIGVATFSGLATGSPLDQSSCNSAGCNAVTGPGATTATAQDVNTTLANELLAACFYMNNTPDWTAQQSYNLRAGTATIDHNFADKVVSSTGTHPNGNIATLATNPPSYVSVFATFKAPAAGGSTRRRVFVIQ